MEDDLETSPPDDADEGTAVCPKCMNELPPAVTFCPSCRAPVTAFANTGYLERALSEGWGVGEAVVTKRPSLLTLVGLWLVLFPVLFIAAGVIFVARGGEGVGGVVGRAFMGVILCGVIWCLQRATRNYLRARRSPEIEAPEDPAGGAA